MSTTKASPRLWNEMSRRRGLPATGGWWRLLSNSHGETKLRCPRGGASLPASTRAYASASPTTSPIRIQCQRLMSSMRMIPRFVTGAARAARSRSGRFRIHSPAIVAVRPRARALHELDVPVGEADVRLPLRVPRRRLAHRAVSPHVRRLGEQHGVRGVLDAREPDPGQPRVRRVVQLRVAVGVEVVTV